MNSLNNAINQSIKSLQTYAETHKYVLLTPAIYKNCKSDIDQWPRHFPEYIFNNSTNNEFYRLDLKMNAMIDELSDLLKQAGYNVISKVFLIGFSIGGHFANRYTILQPSKVKAFAAGGLSGELTMPENFYDGYPMNWSMGTNDFEKLVGESVQLDIIIEIPQFIFWGEQDLFPHHLSEKCEWNYNNYCHWVQVWGENSALALNNQCQFLQEKQYNITFKEYSGVGHQWTTQMYEDIFQFFEQYKV